MIDPKLEGTIRFQEPKGKAVWVQHVAKHGPAQVATMAIPQSKSGLVVIVTVPNTNGTPEQLETVFSEFMATLPGLVASVALATGCSELLGDDWAKTPFDGGLN